MQLDNTKTLRENIDMYLLSEHKSLKTFADELELKYSSLYNVRNHRPSLSVYEKLAEAMDVNSLALYALPVTHDELVNNINDNLDELESMAQKMLDWVESIRQPSDKKIEHVDVHPFNYYYVGGGQHTLMSEEESIEFQDMSDEDLIELDIKREHK